MLARFGDRGVLRDALEDARLLLPSAATRSLSFCCNAASWKWSYAKASCSGLSRPFERRLRSAVRFAKVSMETSTSERKRFRSVVMVSSLTLANSRKATTTVQRSLLAHRIPLDEHKRSGRTKLLELGHLALLRIARVRVSRVAEGGEVVLEDTAARCGPKFSDQLRQGEQSKCLT